MNNFIENNYEEDPTEFEREFSKVDIQGAIDLIKNFSERVASDKIFPESPSNLIKNYQCEVKEVLMGQRKAITDYFNLLLLMGAFYHCDHLSSAFITEFNNLHDECFGFLDRMKINLHKKKLDLYRHQRQASESVGNVILTAPTGSGKTEASMFWLRNQLSQTGQGRVFYVLPFTASINAMYERFCDTGKGPGEEMVAMLHGKLDAYLYEGFFEEGGSLQHAKAQIFTLKQTFKNLQRPLKILTPFQLLKHLFGLKGFEKGIFEWVGGHFIFDEIHSYDPEVTAQIIVLLEYLVNRMQGKIFIMTATLPTFLKNKIGSAIGNYEEIYAEPELYAFTRHRVALEDGLLSEKLHLIEKDLKVSKRVLVVCNTVEQSRKVFEQFQSRHDALLIHGRFAAEDRAKIERRLRKKLPMLLVGTQAIEVSLDIDYDVIYTEPAPLDALFQRFGRVNRRCSKGLSLCVVFKERNKADQYIYNQKTVDKTIQILEEISLKYGGVIEERLLQEYIDYVYPGYDEKSQEKFDKIYDLLTQSLAVLMPFEPSPEREEDYYRQFDGVKVLPAYYEDEFRRRLDKFDFIGAEQLKVSIRKNWFALLINGPFLERRLHVLFSGHKKAKPIKIEYFKINKKYGPLTGLQLDAEEDVLLNNSTNII